MFNPCRECKQKTCPSMCFVKDDYIRHLKKVCKSRRQFENEIETIRRAISAKTVYRVATLNANDTGNGEPSSTPRTSASGKRTSRSSTTSSSTSKHNAT